MPVVTKEVRTNPDPLYPKNVGYQFGGYYLDESLVPTLMYRAGTIAIEDRSSAVSSHGRLQLKRVLRFNSPSPQTIWFRALTGQIAKESELVYQRNGLRLMIPNSEASLRPLSGDPQQSELLLKIQLPQGESSLEFLYEPSPK
jgi:hypothetical protein